jgi:Domain of unknown function (DUF4282)
MSQPPNPEYPPQQPNYPAGYGSQQPRPAQPGSGWGQPPTSGFSGGPAGYPTPPPSERPGTDTKGFFGALFDFSFNSFVTPKIVKIVYILATVGLALVYLLFVVTAFSRGAGSGLVVLILGAIGFFIYLAVIRMTLEFYYAIIRMSEDIHSGRR